MLATSLCGSFLCYLLLQPFLFNKIKYYLNEIDWADYVVNYYQSIPSIYRKSFWLTFLFVNIAYLFHTINFMWGAFDWNAIRFEVDTTTSINQGKFSAFFLQNLLFNGKILPVINNLWSFVGLSLAGILLSYYWELPKKVSTYTIVSLFFATTPYTLGWLYHTQHTLGNLWLPTIILTALLLSQKAHLSLNKNYLLNLISVALIVISLGTYLPCINFIATVILGKIFLNICTSSKSTFKEECQRELQGLANITAAILIYIFIIILLKYNSTIPSRINITTPTTLEHFSLMFNSMFTQFSTPYPFIDTSYKILTLLMCIISLFTLINKTTTPKATLIALGLIPFILISTKLSCLFTYAPKSPNQILQDFYGLPLFYTLFVSLLIRFNTPILKRLTYALTILLIFMSFVRISYALKVWKFGFDAELKLSERIITRLEKMPEFNIEKQYKLLQIGRLPMRQRYYVYNSKERNPELLDLAYYEPNNSSSAFNFFYQTDFLKNNTTIPVATKSAKIKDFILKKATPWPHKNSILIADDYIVLIMSEEGLYKAREKILNTPK